MLLLWHLKLMQQGHSTATASAIAEGNSRGSLSQESCVVLNLRLMTTMVLSLLAGLISSHLA